MRSTNALIKKACFTVKCQLPPSPAPPATLTTSATSSVFLCLSPSRYLSVSLVSLFSPSVSPPAAVSLRFLFLYLLLEGGTPYTHAALTLSEQLMLETRERERERGTFHDLLIGSGERESKLFASRSSLEFLITSRERSKWVWHVCLCVAGTWMS